MTNQLLTNRDNGIRAFPHKFRPAGNTDPCRIGSNAYGSTRLIELPTNLWFAARGERSVIVKNAKKLKKIAVIFTTKVSQNGRISDEAQEADTSLYR